MDDERKEEEEVYIKHC